MVRLRGHRFVFKYVTVFSTFGLQFKNYYSTWKMYTLDCSIFFVAETTVVLPLENIPLRFHLLASLTICTNPKGRIENEVIKEAVECRRFHITARRRVRLADFDLDLMLTNC